MPVNCSERKQPPTSSTERMIACGVVGVNSPEAARKAAPITALTVRTRRKPKRARMVLASVFMISAPAAETKVIRPDCSASSPNPSCSINGSRKGIAPMPVRKTEPPITPVRKVGIRNSDRLSTG
jgi:hypothetical protein